MKRKINFTDFFGFVLLFISGLTVAIELLNSIAREIEVK